MEISTMANIAEIGGGVAILISLLYVGYEVRQSNRIASATALQSILDRFADRTLNQYVEHPDISILLVRGHQSFGNLSTKEAVIFNAWLLREIFHMQNIMQLYSRRLLSSVDYESWLSFTAAHIKTPGGFVSWERQKMSLTPTIVETIENYLADNPEALSLIEMYPEVYVTDGSASSSD